MITKTLNIIKNVVVFAASISIIYIFMFIFGYLPVVNDVLNNISKNEHVVIIYNLFQSMVNYVLERLNIIKFFILDLNIYQLVIFTLFTIISIYLLRVIFISIKKTVIFGKTKKYIQNKMPITICITGFIRTGKDRTGVALTNLLEEMKREQIIERLEHIELILYMIPKKVIKEITYCLPLVNDNMNLGFIKYTIYEKLVLNKININLDDKIQKSNYIILNPEPFTIFEALIYYSYLDFLLSRKTFISSNMPIKNLNNEMSNILEDNMLDLFKSYNKALFDYSVFYSSERNQLKPADKHQEIKNEDQGSNLHLRVFGHTFRESSHFIAIVQNPKELVTVERRIFQSVYQIMNSEVVLTFKFERKILTFLAKLIPSRKIKFMLQRLEKSLYNTGMLRSEILVMQTVDTLERSYDEASSRNVIEKIVLYFPVNYTHFRYNTHAFKLLLDIPRKISVKSRLKDLRQYKSMSMSFEELRSMGFRELDEFTHMINNSRKEYYNDYKQRQEKRKSSNKKKQK